LRRGVEFLLIAASLIAAGIALVDRDSTGVLVNGVLAFGLLVFFYQRIQRAHFDWLSNVCAVFGLPLFTILLLRSYICHKTGTVVWKGRKYAVDAASVAPANSGSLDSSYADGEFVARDDKPEGMLGGTTEVVP
jgi:hypothetical protein